MVCSLHIYCTVSHCLNYMSAILFVQRCKISDQPWTAMNVTRPIFSYMMNSQGRPVAPKTVTCQYEGCGKTFCHSFHLYRHQREKHGQQYKRYKYNSASWQAAHVAIAFILPGSTIFMICWILCMCISTEFLEVQHTVLPKDRWPAEEFNLICFGFRCWKTSSAVLCAACWMLISLTSCSTNCMLNFERCCEKNVEAKNDNLNSQNVVNIPDSESDSCAVLHLIAVKQVTVLLTAAEFCSAT